ncbi:hypothetical protein AB0M02_15405 [Actinoplanes sp. NPDC051861]|uniref:hypothetical protein n=1 Tax=Actinoplanes sp. NPDC051861 TaxID=3155170 RepID=UPI00342D2BD7
MTAPAELDQLTDFFGRYGTALTTGDVAGIARCHTLPGLVVSDSYSFTFSSPAAVALSFLGAAPAYREQRVIAAHAKLLDVFRLSAALALVSVEWEYLDSAGEHVPGERYRYLIRIDADGPLITTVIATK